MIDPADTEEVAQFLKRLLIVRNDPDLDDGLEYMTDMPLMNEFILSEYGLEVEG